MLILVILCAAFLIYRLEKVLYEKFWNRGLDLKIDFENSAIFEGEQSHLIEEISNRSFLPLPFIHAKFRIGTGLDFSGLENVSTSDLNYKDDLFAVLFYQKITRRLPFLGKHRGYYTVKSSDIVTRDLLSLNSMAAVFQQDSALYVYPKKIDLGPIEETLRRLSGELTARTYLFPDPFEFRGIRDYTIQDPFNAINWKASARTGDLMVNEFDSTVTKKIVILLNTEDETVIHHGRLHEEAIRIAGSIATNLLSLGYPVRLVLNGRDVESKETLSSLNGLGPAQNEMILRTLSRIDLSLEPEAFCPFIEREIQDPSYIQNSYIMISSCMKEEVMQAFSKLSDEAATFFIAPLFTDMKDHPETLKEDSYYRWRVEGHA